MKLTQNKGNVLVPKWVLFLSLLVTIFSFLGCNSGIVYRDRVVNIPVPVYLDSLSGYGNINDTIFALKVIKGDTVTDIRYIDKLKKFYIKVKQDTIQIRQTDTLTVVTKVAPSLWDNGKYIFIGIGIMSIIGVIFLILRKV